MPARLTTQEATVQTVQVEIHALKVGKKQVTMGLFRQLPLCVLLDPVTLELHGVPWGHVNYWWDGDESAGRWVGGRCAQKRHVVWQRGEELCRAIVYDVPDPARMRHFAEVRQTCVNALFLLHLPRTQEVQWPAWSPGAHQRITLDGKSWYSTFASKDMDTVRFYHGVVQRRKATQPLRADLDEGRRAIALRQRETQAEVDAESEAAYQQLLARYDLAEDTEAAPLWQRLRALYTERATYEAAHQRQWQALCALPQLFIAV